MQPAEVVRQAVQALPLRLSTSGESASSKISGGTRAGRRTGPGAWRRPVRRCAVAARCGMVRRTPARADGKPRMIAKALRNAHPRRARVAAPNRQDHREWNSPPPNANSCWPIAWPCSTAAWYTTPSRRCPPNMSSVLPRGLAGPIPEDLLRLWRTCFGGRLGYDLEVDYDGHRHPFSFSELFYPDSDGYHDLWGWIEHERELAAEAAAEEGRDWNGKLAYLPFGGFEYPERLYVCVEPGPEHGAVIARATACRRPGPDACTEDSVTRLADDVGGLFRLLSFEQDPFDAENACGVADELLEALDAPEAAGGARQGAEGPPGSLAAPAHPRLAAGPRRRQPGRRAKAASTGPGRSCARRRHRPAATPARCRLRLRRNLRADAAVCWRPASPAGAWRPPDGCSTEASRCTGTACRLAPRTSMRSWPNACCGSARSPTRIRCSSPCNTATPTPRGSWRDRCWRSRRRGPAPASGPRQPRRARAQRRQAGQVGKDGQQPQSRRLPGPGRAPGALPRRAARLRLNPPVPAPR